MFLHSSLVELCEPPSLPISLAFSVSRNTSRLRGFSSETGLTSIGTEAMVGSGAFVLFTIFSQSTGGRQVRKGSLSAPIEVNIDCIPVLLHDKATNQTLEPVYA